MQTRIISNITKKQYPKPHQLRNAKSKICSEKFIISNLNFPSLFLNEKKISQFLPSLYYGLKSKYKNIEKLDVNADSKNILLNVVEFLNNETKNSFYKIEFDNEKNIIIIYKEFEYEFFTLWFITFEKILPLKKKAPKLFNIIIAYLAKFNISNDNVYIDNGIAIAKDEVFENVKYHDKEYIKKVRKEIKAYHKISKEFETHHNLDSLINLYNPKKQQYKKIISLLKNANIEFSFLNSLAIPQTDFVDMENAIYFRELFGFIYNTESVYEDYILPTINSTFQEYDVIPPLDTMIIKNGKIVKDYSYKKNKLKNITDFFNEINTLINNLN